VLQCVAVCCSVLQCVAVCGSDATPFKQACENRDTVQNELQCVIVSCNVV